MAVANPAWRKGDFFRADRIDARIATLPLITGERRVQWLDMSGARLDLAWDRTRQRNTFTFGDPTKPKPNFERDETFASLGYYIAIFTISQNCVRLCVSFGRRGPVSRAGVTGASD